MGLNNSILKDMSREKIQKENFEEIERRIKRELHLKNSKHLVDILGVPQPTYSNRKKKNNFSGDWVITLHLKYNLQVEWILTGEGPKRISFTNEKNIENSYTEKLAEWMAEEEEREDARRVGEIELQIERALPEFREWLDSQNNIKQARAA